MEHATPPVTTRQVSVAEAARDLGISPETVRRWIKSGRLQATRGIRPQGTVWEISLPVTMPRGVPPVTPVTGPSEASRSETEHTSLDEALHPLPPVARHTMDPAPLVASIARLIAELAEVRTISDRRADQLVSQAETIGRQSERVAALELETTRLRAELIAGNHRYSPVAAQQTPAAPAPATDAPVPLMARLRALAPWLLALLAIGAVVVLLVLR